MQAVERCVKLHVVTGASSLVCGQNSRDGFISSKIESRQKKPSFETKREFKVLLRMIKRKEGWVGLGWDPKYSYLLVAGSGLTQNLCIEIRVKLRTVHFIKSFINDCISVYLKKLIYII